MSFSFSIPSNRSKKPSANEFHAAAADAESPASLIKPIPPIPNQWNPIQKIHNLPFLPQTNGPQFELYGTSNNEPSENPIPYGLNLRPPSAKGEPTSSPSYLELMKLRKLREDLEKLPECTRLDEFEDVPVEGYGAAVLAGYGWKEGRGVGRNAKEDVKIVEVAKKIGRGGLGFTGDLCETEKKQFGVGKQVRIVNGRQQVEMKGEIVMVKRGGELLVLRLFETNEKVKVRTRDVVGVGEETCLSELEELRIQKRLCENDC